MTRTDLTRRGFLLGAGALGVTLTAGCAQAVAGEAVPDPEAEKKVSSTPPPPTVVTVGLIAFAPYTIEEGDLSGPIPDVARAVLGKLGIDDVKIQVMNQREQLTVALQAGAIDIAGGMLITPQVCQGFALSVPDHVSGTAFAVAAGNPKGLKIYADLPLKGAKLAVFPGAPEEADALAAGVPQSSIVQVPDLTQLLDVVRTGQADCLAFDDISLRDLVKKNGQGLEVTESFMPDGRPPYVGAYVFPKDSPLLDGFSEELGKLHDSGDWLRIVKPFGFTENNEPPADLTTEKICVG